MSTYAFTSVVGAFTHPDAGEYIFQGQEGVKQMTVANATDRTVHDTAADGAVMVSAVEGASGSLDIECQQTSSLHLFLKSWANLVFTLASAGDATDFAAAAIRIQNIVTGESHTLTGVSPTKIPDQPYGSTGANVTWRLMAANVVNG